MKNSLPFGRRAELNDSIQILSRQRKELHQRRANSSVNFSPPTEPIHKQSLSSNLAESLSSTGRVDIESIKEELQYRYYQQMRRERFFCKALPEEDSVLATEDVELENQKPKEPEKTSFWCCKNLFAKCCGC